jgi:hypothetical protein
VAAALAGGVFDIGDRVACIGGSGSPAFGTRGTVVGVIDEAVEVRGWGGTWMCEDFVGVDWGAAGAAGAC